MSKEAMKLALEALKTCTYTSSYYKDFSIEKVDDSIKALEETLAKQEQGEPVGYLEIDDIESQREYPHNCRNVNLWYEGGEGFVAIYTTPQPKQEQGEPLCTAAMFDDAFLAKSGLSPDTKLYTTPQQRKPVEGVTDGSAKQEHTGEPVYCQLRHVDTLGNASPWGTPLDAKERHSKWAAGIEMRLLYTTPQQRKPLTRDERENVFAEADKLMDANDNLSWRIAILKATEAVHNIKE
jgi:hypothetical protein